MGTGHSWQRPSPAWMRVLSHHGWFHGVSLSTVHGSCPGFMQRWL